MGNQDAKHDSWGTDAPVHLSGGPWRQQHVHPQQRITPSAAATGAWSLGPARVMWSACCSLLKELFS